MDKKDKDINAEKVTGITGRKKIEASCESCEFYDYDDECDAYVCKMDLDEDEMISFLSGNTRHCNYYFRSRKKKNFNW